ncbi:hypothetical protein AOC36_01380 [Erysipelothrix larvae]|uniref:Thymidylate kinase-like domain-containing protein n=1 Tax=Erysipelothrix larvae TaxID=1514105 RepID=A0A109UGK7_9FIRM|nr:hypothetical protein [Erysipelothrix larvae]AMC92688.1 hypothetical protein AOC36_01380 [Erysipelothrix larvae]
MGTRNNTCILIEFNGLPGCGKTTIVNELENLMEKEGVHFLNLKDVYFYKEKHRISKIITVTFAAFSRKQRTQNIKIMKYLFLFDVSKERVLYALRLIKLLYQVRRVKDKGCGEVMILEEGILQYTASISHVDTINNQNLLSSLIESMIGYVDSIICVNCNLDYSDIVKRIRQRNDLQRRFDSMDDDQLIEGLVQNMKCFNIMRRSYQKIGESIDIDTIGSPIENSRKIQEKYKSYTD